MDDDYEHVLLVKPDVFVYKIPARSSISRAHRASDWKLDQPDWKGRLRLVLKGQKCILKLEDKENCKLFAECFIEKFPGNDVESVSDSSRYFVIRIKNPNDGRSAFIGIGFEDRSDSFDLNVALQDHFKRVTQEKEQADNLGNEDDDTPKIDLSLKEGQTIKVNLNIGKKSSSTSRPKPKSTGSMGILLPPPPGISKQHSTATQSSIQSKTTVKQSANNSELDILSFESPNKQSNVLDEFDNLALTSSNNDDWNNFESYKIDNRLDNKLDNELDRNLGKKLDSKLDNLFDDKPTTTSTNTSDWATFF